MNLHNQKTEVLLKLAEINAVEGFDKMERPELLEKLTALKEDNLLNENLPEEKPSDSKAEQKGKSKKPAEMAPGKVCTFEEFRLTPLGYGNKKSRPASADLDIPMEFDAAGEAVKFAFFSKGKALKRVRMTPENASVLNEYSHTSHNLYVFVGE